MPIFKEIFTSINILVFIIFDEDDISKENHNKINNKIEYNCSFYIKIPKNLEKFCKYSGEKYDYIQFINHLETLKDETIQNVIDKHKETINNFFKNNNWI